MADILVPMDGSPDAEKALEKALDMFPTDTIHVLNVIQITKIPDDPTTSGLDHAVSESEGVLARATEIADEHGGKVTTHSTEGHAAKTINSYAEEHDIDHIVMGSTGRSGVRRLLLGSVAETVIRRAPCSVTVVRD
ncbi:MAG: universal stress protein [Halobacteriota archaeon]|uniref:universal stress protein n=1 Tax=Natronomonas sp. TaxID=2184060 RepID=UPI003975D6D8